MCFETTADPLAAVVSAMGAPKVKAGTVIAGRYRLVAPLSRGGMGSVWRAEHLSLGSPIAIKLIDASLVEHPEARARFEREARAAAALRSPHVVQILDHGVDKDLPFMAMELLEGESLAGRLHRVRTLTPPQTVRVLQDVARAMRKAHEAGIIHRDLKPDNIFLVRNDDLEIAKVLDFGIAKSQEPFGQWTGGTRTGALIGTPQYMSPEQTQGQPIDHTTDLWALGVIAFECVCGRLPFPSEKPGELILQICAHPMPVPSKIARVPPRFDAWFARACDRDPRGRFSTAKELTDALAEALGTASADVSGPVQAMSVAPSLPSPQAVPVPQVVPVPYVAPVPHVAAPPAAGAFGPTGTVLPLSAPPQRAPHAHGAPPPAAAPLEGLPSVAEPVSTGALTVVRAPAPPVAAAVAQAVSPGTLGLPSLGGGADTEHTTLLAARSGGTINGAVMDSDPATFVALSGARSKKIKLAVAAGAAALVGVVLLVALSGDPGAGPSPDSGGSPAVPPASTPSVAVTPAEPVPSTTETAGASSSATAPGTTGPAASGSPSGTAKVGPKASGGPRGTAAPRPSGTGTVNPLIGW